MEKQIKDYLHYYMGHELLMEFNDGSTGILRLDDSYLKTISDWVSGRPIPVSAKLMLRPLSDMTAEEWKSIRDEISFDIAQSVGHPDLKFSDKPKWVLVFENRLKTNNLRFNDGIILMRMGFDLFGLLEAGLAIDKTTINQQ